MEVATELMAKEAMCNSDTSDNSGTSHILYVLCMILTKIGLFKKNPNKYKILLTVLCYFIMLQMP